MRRLAAEGLGTFALVFAGTGAIVIDAATGGAVGHVGIALTFGLVVLAMIYAVGDVSGAHINPAVSLGFVVSGRMAPARAAGYILAQCAGAILATLLLLALFPAAPTLGQTHPAGPAWQSCILEGVLTFFLMYVILAVSTGSKEKGLMAGVAVGATIGLEALFAGPITGASMNPARSLAPALVTGDFAHLWLYVLGPVAGAALASPLHAWISGGRDRPA
ncbi:MAG: aquaporin [Phycisphaerales bacterium]|nr:aquaporin [Phycisphaerales bacterium]